MTERKVFDGTAAAKKRKKGKKAPPLKVYRRNAPEPEPEPEG